MVEALWSIPKFLRKPIASIYFQEWVRTPCPQLDPPMTELYYKQCNDKQCDYMTSQRTAGIQSNLIISKSSRLEVLF